MAYVMPAIDFTLSLEGGFVENGADPGGATNYGVTLATLHKMGDPAAYDTDFDGDVDATDVRLMTREQAIDFYRKTIWEPWPFASLRDRIVAAKFFDMHVNLGPKQATRVMQRALAWFRNDVTVDGVFGPGTVSAINMVTTSPMLLKALVAELAQFYFTLVDEKSERKVFLLGWLRRAYTVPV